MKILLEGKTKEIMVYKFYDLDGDIINEGTDTQSFDTEKDFKITSTWKKIGNYEYEDWEVYVDGKRFGKEYEITGYTIKENRLILKGCTGAG